MLRSPSLRFVSYVVLLLMAASMIIPVWSVIVTSFSSRYASLQPGIMFWPSQLSLDGYATLFYRVNLLWPFLNTMYVTIVGTLIHVVLSCLAGYALTQEDLPFRRSIAIFIVVTLTIPSQVILVPLFVIFRQLHLLNTLYSLIVSGAVSAFSILLMKTYFEQIPKSLIESAKMDGAGSFLLLRDFYLPLALPGVMTIAAFEIVARYNMFTEPLLFINNPDLNTLQIALRAVVLKENPTSNSDFVAPNASMAGIVVAIVPLLLFYPFIQRFLVRGITIGGVKE
jgi:putative aldouronate transport system permease protein